MKRFYLSSLSLLAAFLFGFHGNSSAQTGITTFVYTGAVQVFTVTPGTFAVSINAIGANGGNNAATNDPGLGGRVQCVMSVTPGEVLYIYVGAVGLTGNYSTLVPGGYDGGGEGNYYGGGGGGASDIRITNAPVGIYGPALGNLGYRVVVAGGGGGGGYGDGTCTGGNGGGTSGANGSCSCSAYIGYGGTQTAGGASGDNEGTAGIFGIGGNAWSSSTYYGGGGGGGYYGGGGAYAYGGGGGGSSYTDPTLVTSFTHTQGYNNGIVPGGNGQITIFPICTPPTPGTITGQTNLCLPATGSLSVPFSYTGSSGGGWYSSNAAVAMVSNTGVVTAVGVGTTIISYSLVYSCGPASGTAVVTVNPTPLSTFPANSTFCQGTTQNLTNSSPGGGTWSSSNTILASVGATTGIVTGNAGGNAIITYNLTDGCITTATVNMNPAPLAISGAPGASGLCIGSTVTLSDASTGGTWTSTHTSIATVDPLTGIVTGATNPGAALINYVFTGTGCSSSVTFSVIALPSTTPAIHPSGVTSYCSGGTGVNITLSGSQGGTSYQLYNGLTQIGAAENGSGGTLTFGGQTAAGNYTIIGKIGNCSSVMSGTTTVTVEAPPYMATLTGGGSYCSSLGGLDLILDSTQIGTGYQLIQVGVGIVDYATIYNFVDPTWPALDFGDSLGSIGWGSLLGPGSYFAIAFSPSTGCQDTMNGIATITLDDTPAVQNVTVSNGGVYCSGGSGVHVGLDNSVPGINYQLYYDGSALPSVLPGTNSSIDFGLNDSGTYTVEATNAITGCADWMNGTPTVAVNPLPDTFSVLGTASRCYGTAAIPVSIANTDVGVNYQLYRNDTAIGIPILGDGTTDTFGAYFSAGNYTAMATDATTGCTTPMPGNAVITVNSLPTVETVTVSNSGYFCAGDVAGVVISLPVTQPGATYNLENLGSTEGTLTGTGGAVSYVSRTMTGYYTVDATIGSCTSMMANAVSIYMNPLPEHDTITGGGAYCIGGAGLHVGLSYSSLGINYQLYNGTSTVGLPVAGSNSAIDFGTYPTAGTYWVTAVNTYTTCHDTMAGNTPIVINTLPATFTVSNGGSYCAGGSGVAVGLSGSNTGINYQLYYDGSMIGSPVSGTGTSISFGLQTEAGTYTVKAANVTTGCPNNMTGSKAVSINPLPTSYNVTGGGGYCAGGTGVDVSLNGSNTGVSYQLMSGTSTSGLPKLGTGSPIDFGSYTGAGSYTVYATNATTLCANNMNGNADVVVNALPTVYAVTGGGNYCAGSPGVHIGVGGSTTGLSYQMYNGGAMFGSAVTGVSGSPLDFGLVTTTGTYTVKAVNTITGCANNMSGSKTVNVNSLPVAYTVTGGGAFCAGSAGAPVGVSGSVTGVTYTLMNSAGTVASLMGTGGALNYGYQSTSGDYSVTGTSIATGCTNNMMGGASITVNPIPVAYSVTGGGSYCSGGTGVHIGLIGSGYGINYQLINGSTTTGLPIGGTASALDMGLQIGAGTYTVKATNVITGCTNNMTGSASVTIIPTVVPSLTVSNPMGDTVCEGIANNFTASSANGGSSPVYQWMVNSVDMGSGATFSYVPANGDLVTCQLTSSAACATPATITSSVNMDVMNYVLPSAVITANPGSNICPGTSVTFSATTENGGSAPYITWVVNSNNTAPGNSSYTYAPAANDIVGFMLVSNQKCRSEDTVYSKNIQVTIQPPFVPSFSVSSHLGPKIGVGQSDTLRALVTNGGVLSLSYQWFIDGNLVYNANTNRLIVDTIFNNDTISCVVSAIGECGTSSSAQGTRIHLENLGVQTVSSGGDIKVVPNPNKGDFTITGTLGSADNEEVSVEVTNMLGQVVYTGKATTNSGVINEHIQLNGGIANGMYLLSLRAGTENSVFHFVVEK